MAKKSLLLIVVFLAFSVSLAQSAPPYLYYYSRLLGGIIIEHADGTDSRLIGADVIPPGMTGLVGPGWSPSGRYFAAREISYGDYNAYSGGAFLIDTSGIGHVPWLNMIVSAGYMEWSPEELLLVGGSTSQNQPPYQSFYWLVDPATESVLAEFGMTGYGIGNVVWTPDGVVIYANPETYTQQYFRVTMSVDSTVLREPITRDEFLAHYTEPDYDASDPIYDAYGLSPSGRYEASGKYPTILRDLTANTEVELPTHSQGTVCRGYRWSEDEQYIITLDGTLVAGGGCAGAMIGVTDSEGELWRELGGCSWSTPPCVDWLPPQVDVSALPPGQSQPIQLDPVGYEAVDDIMYGYDSSAAQSHLFCIEYALYNIVQNGQIVFALNDPTECPYNSYDSFAAEGLGIVTAFDNTHKLLAIYGWGEGVSIWTICDGVGLRIKRLNSDGYLLEFTPDGEQLRARNVNAWKIYDVQDILDTAEAAC